jgi:hypothetical protein
VGALRTAFSIFALLLALLVVACEQPPETPEAAVEQLFEALSMGDQEAILDCLCPANRGDFGGMEFVLNLFGLSTPPVGYRDLAMRTTMLDAATAEVYTTGSLRLLFFEQAFELPFRTVKEGDRWYVCDESTPFSFQ